VVLPRTHYTLNVQFDYAQHFLTIEEQVEFTNATAENLASLVFAAEPNRQSGILENLSIVGKDEQLITSYSLEDNRLEIPLSTPLLPAQSLSLVFHYDLRLPAIPPPSEAYKPVPFGYTERQTNLVDWYFFLPPYQPGKGWLLHPPGYYGEHLVYEVADFDVVIQPVGSLTDYTLAASAAAQPEGTGARYQVENARSFAWSASPYYEVLSQQVGQVMVYSYSFPYDKSAAEQTLRDTAAALGLYSELFAPYPHTTLSVVEADFLDGMEYDGLYFLSKGFYNLYDGSPKGYLSMIAVHETAHQWWYGLVGNDQALEPWLDEALATYTERIFYEKTYPDLIDWWWGYRVDYYDPKGFINGPIYPYNGFLNYRNAVYLNGARFLEDLREQMGDEVFFAFLKGYASRYSHKLATTPDFLELLTEYTDADVSQIINQYFSDSQ